MLKKNDPSAPNGDWTTYSMLALLPTSNATQLKKPLPAESNAGPGSLDRKSTRLNSSHGSISYAVSYLIRRSAAVSHFPYTTLFRSGRVVIFDHDVVSARRGDVEEKRSVGTQWRLDDIQHARVATDIECDATEEAPARRIERRSRVAGRIIGVARAGPSVDGVVVRIAHGCQF